MSEIDLEACARDCFDKASLVINELEPIDIGTFLNRDYPPRENWLDPILPKAGLMMIYAPRGIGKTYAALYLSMAVALGKELWGFKAPRRAKVVYIDGEMSASLLQERLHQVVKYYGEQPEPEYFKILAADNMADPMPNLADLEVWQKQLSHLLSTDVIVIDNLSTLFSMGRENEAESWVPAQKVLLWLRRKGISVILIHHAGKNGEQRGTSKREDILDTVIALRRPQENRAKTAHFEVHIEKSRAFYGDALDPFEVKLNYQDDKPSWDIKSIERSKIVEAFKLYNQGKNVAQVKSELGVSRTSAYRFWGEWKSKRGSLTVPVSSEWDDGTDE
jgi:putative DNA primase/helicase